MKRPIALTLALIVFVESVFPPAALALTSGPSQPEFASFTPFEQTSLVDNFTGDFKYNIPLMDVDGYPLNLAYESGVSQEMEASWVGLGWSLNPGSVSRSVRGLPDDFKGADDKLITNSSMRERRVFEAQVTVKPNAEIVGFPLFKGKGRKSKKPGKPGGGGIIPSITFGITFDNYYGMGFKYGLPLTTNLDLGKATANLGLNIGYSSASGYNLNADLSLSSKESKEQDKTSGKQPKNISLGTSWNSQQGFTGLQLSQNAFWKNSPLSEVTLPFGTRSYTPQLQNDKKSLTIGGDFGFGLEFFWFTGKVNIGGSYSQEGIRDSYKEAKAYGYMYHADAPVGQNKVITDYNRESDALVTKELPLLPTAHATFDYYSVSGQGVGGNYRPHLGQASAIFDESAEHKSDGYDIGVEFAGANYFKGAANLAANFSINRSGAWNEYGDPSGLLNNIVPYTSRSVDAQNAFTAHKSGTTNIYEPVAFKKAGELNETDYDYFRRFHFTSPVALNYTWNGEFDNKLVYAASGGGRAVDASAIANGRNQRITRTETFDYLTGGQASVGGLESKIYFDRYVPATKTYVADSASRNSSFRRAHHISEIKVTRQDGYKFYYGLPVYQLKKVERTCSVGAGVGVGQRNSQKITIGGNEMSKSNTSGVDHFFRETETTAHATSYLLTAMVSADYIDVNNNGPSSEDIGTYVKFGYAQTHSSTRPYRWRTPTDANQGNLSEGNYASNQDNKAVVSYGEKEVYYLKTIKTKNYIAEFYISERNDALPVASINGGKDASSKMMKLDSISLYSLSDRTTNGNAAVPIKTVHFVYDYSLCSGIPNAVSGGGKLTLKKVYFTYRGNKKASLNPYVFTYSSQNPGYIPNAQDVWGNYARQRQATDLKSGTLSNSEFPFVVQNQTDADLIASSWLLTQIDMPTGGSIKVDYESDSYAFVQAERAMQMTAIRGFSRSIISGTSELSGDLFSGGNPNNYVYFDIPASLSDLAQFRKQYTEFIDNLYFKCFVDLTGKGDFEFVSGFAQVESSGILPGLDLGWVKLKDVDTERPRANAPTSPIAKLAWQNTRVQLNELINPPFTLPSSFKDVLERIKNEVRKLEALATGVNASLRDFGYGKKTRVERCFIRLNSPNLNKLGGGSRVKKLTFSDNWNSMAGAGYTGGTYGYTYSYTTNHPVYGNISSGVAQWEPAQGGDENPYRQPLAYSIDRILAPNENLVRELPAGEALYPNASVGYSKVTVDEIKTNAGSRGVGKTVHEFYTAKDFPIQTSRIGPFYTPENQLVSKLLQIFKQYSTTKLYASQGLSLEFSNMHGVQKSVQIYGDGNSSPISRTDYHYKSQQAGTTRWGDPTYRLVNECDVIRPSGKIEKAHLGVDFDVVSDFREYRSADEMDKLALNLDISGILFIIIPVFTGYPSVNLHRSIMRTANILKTTTRYPILEKVVKTDLSSTVTETSVAYDAQTGNALVTSLQNQYNDLYYKLNIPAYWGYSDMGACYTRSGTQLSLSITTGGKIAGSGFLAGDVVLVGTNKYWVVKQGNDLYLKNYRGIAASTSGTTTAQIIQPAARNQLAESILAITCKKNPISGTSLTFTNLDVIDAGGTAFSNFSISDCACAKDTTNTNPFVNGTYTAYLPGTTYKFLTGRKYTGTSVNTVNTRVDGAYSTFSSLWKAGTPWTMVPNGWVAENTVTLRNPNNAEMESKDAINQYKAMRYTYNQKIPKAMATNARYQEILFEHFEEGTVSGENNCMDKMIDLPAYLSQDKAHTGKTSIKVAPNSNANVKFNLVCPK